MIARASRVGPLPLAIGLALAAVPFVAWSLLVGNPAFASVATVIRPEDAGLAEHPARGSLGQILTVAALAVLAAAVAGGWEGSLARRGGRTRGILAAIAAAWAVGIAVVPLAAWLLHVPLDPGLGCTTDPCPGWLVDAAPWSGLVAYGRSLIYSPIVWPGVAIAVIIALLSRRSGPTFLTSAATIAAFAAVNVFSVTLAPLPFGCLVLGVFVWDTILAHGEAARA